MQPPLTIERLAGNAFRTLGVAASSDQSAVTAAARRMRIWTDATRIPPTPFDATWLGPVARSRSDVEQAVARLSDPVTRADERLLWYLAAPTEAPHDVRAAAAAPIEVRHDAAVAALHAVSLGHAANPGTFDAARWLAVVEQLNALARSPEYIALLERLEADGGFDMVASPGELVAAAERRPAALGAALIPSAEAFLADGAARDAESVDALLGVLRAAGALDTGGDAVGRLLDRLEDQLSIYTHEIDAHLREKLRTNHETPEPFFADNFAATQIAVDAYGRRVARTLGHLISIAAEDEARVVRVRSRCAELLVLVALGWEWSGLFITAEQTLRRALHLAESSAVAAQVRTAMERVRPKAQRERNAKRGWAPYPGEDDAASSASSGDDRPLDPLPLPPPGSKPRRRRPPTVVTESAESSGWSGALIVWLVVAVGGALLRGLSSSSSTSSIPPWSPPRESAPHVHLSPEHIKNLLEAEGLLAQIRQRRAAAATTTTTAPTTTSAPGDPLSGFWPTGLETVWRPVARPTTRPAELPAGEGVE